MQAFVFTDKALAGQAGRFVWLEIDTEKRENATFRRQYAVQALPTFFIVDPAAYRAALDAAPKDWPAAGRATESLGFALLSTDESESCGLLARDAFEAEGLRHFTSRSPEPHHVSPPTPMPHPRCAVRR